MNKGCMENLKRLLHAVKVPGDSFTARAQEKKGGYIKSAQYFNHWINVFQALQAIQSAIRLGDQVKDGQGVCTLLETCLIQRLLSRKRYYFVSGFDMFHLKSYLNNRPTQIQTRMETKLCSQWIQRLW